MSWTECTIGDAMTLKRGHDLPARKRTMGDVPVVSSSGISGYHNEARADAPGVVTGRYGTLGEVYFIEQAFWPHNTALYVSDFKDNVPRFIAYFLKNAIRNYRSDKAAVPGVDRNVLHKLRARLPDRSTQERISEFLSAYDDLIENNRQRIALLERAAREVYREWFVRLRFPGHENTRLIEGLPVGWEKKTLGEVLSCLESGGRPKGGAQEVGIPSIGAENVIGLGQYDFTKEKYIPEEYFDSMRRGVLRSRDVVVYKDGANIGRSSFFGDGFPHERCAVNEHVFILRALPDVGQSLLYFWVAEDETRQHIANLNSNTAQPGVSQSKLRTLTFVHPATAVVSEFTEFVEPVIRKIFVLARMNRELERARDLLMPRLISGEIEV